MHPRTLSLAVVLALATPVLHAEPKAADGAAKPAARYVIVMSDVDPGAGTYLVDTATGRVWMPMLVPVSRRRDVVQLVELERADVGTKLWKKAKKKAVLLLTEGPEAIQGGGAVEGTGYRDQAQCIQSCAAKPNRGWESCERTCAGAGGTVEIR